MTTTRREQYMSGETTHRQYYAAFVIQASKDQHFNDIALAKWDVAANAIKGFEFGKALIASGDFRTLSAGVCVLKEAARQILEEMNA